MRVGVILLVGTATQEGAARTAVCAEQDPGPLPAEQTDLRNPYTDPGPAKLRVQSRR